MCLYYATHFVQIFTIWFSLQSLGIIIVQEDDVTITCLNYGSSLADLVEKDKTYNEQYLYN